MRKALAAVAETETVVSSLDLRLYPHQHFNSNYRLASLPQALQLLSIGILPLSHPLFVVVVIHVPTLNKCQLSIPGFLNFGLIHFNIYYYIYYYI